MENCILCQIVNGRLPSKKVYEDDDVMAVLDINGSNLGHTFVMPKHHYTILEHVPNKIIGMIFNTSNKISKALFEAISIQGTNIFVTNGVIAGQMVAHFMVNVIPRKENDAINLLWKPKQLTEEELSTIELQLKDAIAHVPEEENKKIKKESVILSLIKVTGKESYITKQIRRIP